MSDRLYPNTSTRTSREISTNVSRLRYIILTIGTINSVKIVLVFDFCTNGVNFQI